MSARRPTDFNWNGMMANIDFVPNDYIQKRESTRANFLYLFLFIVVMAGIGATFSVIKMRQKSINDQLAAIDVQLEQAQVKFALLEQLQAKGIEMMRTASMTADLFENVPRSIVLACITNNLPKGVSLQDLKLFQKVSKTAPASAKSSTQYSKASKTNQRPVSKEQMLETFIEIKGVAPSDIEVASYMSHLSGSMLLERTALVESKEFMIDESKFREFKLTTKIKHGLQLTKEDVEAFSVKDETTAWLQ